MNDIRISPTVQLGALAALVAVVVALFMAQEPEIRRYLKMKSM